MEDPDNSGLEACIKATKLAEAYEAHCEKVSLADFIVIAAEAAMGRTANSWDAADPYKVGTLTRDFRNSFQAGRTTVETCDWNVGLMPNAEMGCDHVKTMFTNHIFMDSGMNEFRDFTPAIQGAHTIGQARLKDSGYNGAWTSETSYGKFNNDYFKDILRRGWGPELAIDGNKGKN